MNVSTVSDAASIPKRGIRQPPSTPSRLIWFAELNVMRPLLASVDRELLDKLDQTADEALRSRRAPTAFRFTPASHQADTLTHALCRARGLL